MILVTGGTGLVGSHLLYNLCKTNSKVIAIYRNKDTQRVTKEIFKLYDSLATYQHIIWKKADIINITELEHAFLNITHVYHAAAMVSFRSKDVENLRKINIEGTANIVNLCITHKIDKLCYVSSIATVAKTPGKEFIDETCEWTPEGNHSDYSISKFGAEMEVWRGSQEGLNIVIVNPGVIFGFGAWNVNSSKLFIQIKKGFSFYTEGVVGVVGVKDVVKSMVLLMDSNIQNQRFILVADNKNYKSIFKMIAHYLNVKSPNIKVSSFFTEIAWRLNRVLSFLSLNTIDLGIYKYTSKAAHKKRFYDGSKIEKSIAFNYTPFDTVIQEICNKLS